MYKLRKIKRKDLDLEKYSNALNDSLNYRIYAEYWYLDVLMDEDWECWIYGDYEVIMPIPFQLKLGVKFVLQPTYCQQLGVFYKEEISRELFQQFEKKLHKYFVRSYSFNEENTASFQPKGEPRVNYILDLNRPYEEIFNSYKKDKRKNIRKEHYLKDNVCLTDDLSSFFRLFQQNQSSLYEKFHLEAIKLFEVLRNRSLLDQFIVKVNDDIMNHRIYIKSKNRIIVIASTRDKAFKEADYSTLILDEVIRLNSNSNLKIDFEGSMVKGVASFNESFGAQKSYYTVYSNFKFRANRILKYQ